MLKQTLSEMTTPAKMILHWDYISNTVFFLCYLGLSAQSLGVAL